MSLRTRLRSKPGKSYNTGAHYKRYVESVSERAKNAALFRLFSGRETPPACLTAILKVLQCPKHCEVKVKRLLLITILLIALFSVGCFGSAPKLAVTAERLYYDYYTDQAAADELYKDTKLHVTGIISSLGTSSNGQPYVILEVGDLSETQGVQCSFTSKHASLVASLSVGQQISLIGKCWGSSGNVVILVD